MSRSETVRFVAILCAAACFLSVAGCGSGISKTNYDKINNGMTEAEVESILGKGEEQAAAGVNVPSQSLTIPGGVNVSVPGISSSVKVKKWQDGGKSITITFSDGKVMAKAQKGL
jgi:hypothetical protein